MSLPRFHVDGVGPGASVALPEWTARHARDVLRLPAGAPVTVFDGRGAEYAATLDHVTRREVRARVTGRVEARPESPLRIVLAVPPLKGDRLELVLQKSTELGVAEIWPVVTARTDAMGKAVLAGARHERWERVLAGAAEQCGRAVVPALLPAVRLPALLARAFTGLRVVLDERSGPPPLAAVHPGPAPDAVLLLVGPAGGWAEDEAHTLSHAGFSPVSLGPRILRAETAALVAVALVQSRWGDLG